MIARLLSLFTTLVASVSVATVIAAGILGAYYTRAWQLNREKLLLVLAVAQGAELETLVQGSRAGTEEPSTEQPSYAQILEARAAKTRNLELREQALRSGLQQLQTEERKLAEGRKQLQQLRESFQGELLAMEKGATATGREDARRTLETIKPKQAKELVAHMLEGKEIDEVVLLLAGMPEGKRAKIIAEFKTPAEIDEVGEVLRRIRQGLPAAGMADNTQRQLEPPKGPGL
jgi:flagellar motility protein MotE (MotC chaperone)